jgi:hypothetical protein
VTARVVRRLGGWLRRSWALATDPGAESEALVRAFVVAAVAQARRVQCSEHPGRPSVVVLITTDGTLVGRCSVCALVHTPEQLQGPAGVAVAA